MSTTEGNKKMREQELAKRPRIKVVREFAIPQEATLVKVRWGGEELVYGVMEVRVPPNETSLLSERHEIRGRLRLHSDGYYRPTAYKFDIDEQMILTCAANGYVPKLYGDCSMERVIVEPQERMRMVSFDANMPEGNEAGFTLGLCQNGRWLPLLADLSVVKVGELRADGMEVPDGGFESVEQFREQLVKDGYTNLSPVEE